MSESRLPKALVLLSSWNGKDFIEEQLRTILAQEGVDVEVRVRDDGSTDGTADLLRKLEAKEQGRILVTCGENIGVVGSFLALIADAPEKYDFYALSDQDDFWLIDKLYRATSCLREHANGPALYFSSLMVADERLRPIRKKTVNGKKGSLENALVENLVTGCTAVMNLALLRSMKKHMPKDPSMTVMHDWWLYLVASATGKLVYDRSPYILYRQHRNNVIGEGGSRFSRMLARFKRFMLGGFDCRWLDQANHFSECFPGLVTPEIHDRIDSFSRGKKRGLALLRDIITFPCRRMGLMNDFAMRVSLYRRLSSGASKETLSR